MVVWSDSFSLSRRRLLQGGLVCGATIGAGLAWKRYRSQPVLIPEPPNTDRVNPDLPFDPMQTLREFDRGQVSREQGKTLRTFELTASSLPLKLNSAISFVSWSYNRRLPGPTLRATVGDRLRIIFHNQEGRSHSIHFHGTHPAAMDGVQPVRQGDQFIYEFEVSEPGLYPYHCHIAPVTRHVGKGLYGLLIVDPPQGRSPADELVLVMGGFDLDDKGSNEIYAFNGIPNYFRDRPIRIYQGQKVRVYLVNMIEFDPAVTFHIHANLFDVFPSGSTLHPAWRGDVITLGTAERHILEFTYNHPGSFMFHPHQDHIAEQGCMGVFEVVAR